MPFELLAQVQDNADAARQMLEQAATTPEVAPVMETISVWELIQNGGWYIMGPLALMSLIAVYTVSYTHLRAHETVLDLVCRLLLEKKQYNTYLVSVLL